MGVKAVGWAESSRTPARAQSFGGCWSVYSEGLPALYICDGNLLMVPGSYKVSKAEPGPLHMKIQPGFPRGSSSIGAGPRLASAWEGPGCRSHGDAAGNLLTVPCQVGLASLGPRGGGPAGSLLPGRERVARHRIPAACVPFLAPGPWRRGRRRGEQAGGISWNWSSRLEEGAHNPGPGQGRGWGRTACSTLSGTSDWEEWGRGRLRHTPWPRRLSPSVDPGQGGGSRLPGRPVAWSTVFIGSGGGVGWVGRRLAWGPPLSACWLPLWTTPMQGFPGAVPPTHWAGMGGARSPPQSTTRL